MDDVFWLLLLITVFGLGLPALVWDIYIACNTGPAMLMLAPMILAAEIYYGEAGRTGEIIVVVLTVFALAWITLGVCNLATRLALKIRR